MTASPPAIPPHGRAGSPSRGAAYGPRRAAAIVAAAGWGVFVVAAWLSPYEADGRPRLSGTHRQLGLPACQFRESLALPCPGCGMTTSVALLVHGDPAAAWRANGAGPILAVAAAAAVAWLSVVALVGVDPGRFTAERTVEWLATGGAAVALLRWVGLGVWWLAAGAR